MIIQKRLMRDKKRTWVIGGVIIGFFGVFLSFVILYMQHWHML